MNRSQRRASGKQAKKGSGVLPDAGSDLLTQTTDLSFRGLEHYRAGRYDQAIVAMRQAVGLNDRIPVLHSNLGAAYQAVGRLDEAVASYRQALALQPDLAEAHYNLGVALERQGNLSEAVTCYQRAVTINPGYSQARESMLYARHKEDGRASVQMDGFITTYWISQAVCVAAKLGISDLLLNSPKTIADLARATNAHPLSLRRLLLFLASLGIYAEDPDGRFRQTLLSDTLRKNHPQSVHAKALAHGKPEYWKMLGDLYNTVATGEPAFDREHGMPYFEYIASHPDDAASFNAQMASNSSSVVMAILGAYDFSRFKVIMDVGGGQGALLHGILTAYPHASGILADLPGVVGTVTDLKIPGEADRCKIVGIDFFSDIPAGADAYVLKNILHDWDDEDSLKILKNCRRAIPADGCLLIVEFVLGPSNQPDPGRWGDMEMMLLLRGRERSRADFIALLKTAGFELVGVSPVGEAGSNLSIIEARPA